MAVAVTSARRSAVILFTAFAVLWATPVGANASSAIPRPTFVGTIPNVTVTSGRDAALPCIVDNIGDYQVAWMHLDRVMLLTINQTVITLIPRFRVTKEDSNTWTLHIKDVQPEDTGYYVCQVNMEPVINQVGYVQVVVPPKFIDSESSQSHVSVHEENDVELVCRAEGFPKPKIKWTREDNKPFTSKGAGQEIFQIESEKLIIKGVSRKDMGAYLCIATNKVPPSISKRIVLDIHFEPVITVPNQLVGAPEGTSVTLECQVAAFPNAVHFWKFTGHLLINSTRQETHEIRKGFTTTMKLHLRNLREEDFGNYVCAAKNSLGEAESNVRLYAIMVDKKGDEEKKKEKTFEPDLRPEQRSDDRHVDPWHRQDLDSNVPSYNLEESNRIHGDSIPPNRFSDRVSDLGRDGSGSNSIGSGVSLAAESGACGASSSSNLRLILISSGIALCFLAPLTPKVKRVAWLWVFLAVALQANMLSDTHRSIHT